MCKEQTAATLAAPMAGATPAEPLDDARPAALAVSCPPVADAAPPCLREWKARAEKTYVSQVWDMRATASPRGSQWARISASGIRHKMSSSGPSSRKRRP